MRRIVLAAAIIFAAVTNLWAQGSGQLPAWNVLGNPSAAASNARSASLNALFNGAFCSTANTFVARVGGSWVCQGLGTGLSFAGGNLTVAPPWSSITGTPTTLAGYGITSPLPYVQGGCNATTQVGCTNNVFPTPTRAGDLAYWNGSSWITLPGNNSGTQSLTENASGVPAWSAAGTGTVTSVICGTGLSGGTITTTGTCAIDTGVKVNVINTTRDLTLASGTQDVTGFGFNPTSVNVNYAINGAAGFGIGSASSNGNQGSSSFATDITTTIRQTTAGIFIGNSGVTNFQLGIVSFITDGIRVTWTKTGAPTGTLGITIIGFR